MLKIWEGPPTPRGVRHEKKTKKNRLKNSIFPFEFPLYTLFFRRLRRALYLYLTQRQKKCSVMNYHQENGKEMDQIQTLRQTKTFRNDRAKEETVLSNLGRHAPRIPSR